MYAVELLPSAARALARLDRPTQKRLARAIDRLGTKPRGRGCVKLRGSDDVWRVRVGDYRILYQIWEHVLHLCVMERVGIRELRQNLSVYVKHVREEGRAYEVTERGEPVARLTPLEGRETTLIERMLADGRIAPASRRWDEIPPPLPALKGKPLSRILQEMRDEEPW